MQCERIPERDAKYSEISEVKDNDEGDQKTLGGGSSIYGSSYRRTGMGCAKQSKEGKRESSQKINS